MTQSFSSVELRQREEPTGSGSGRVVRSEALLTVIIQPSRGWVPLKLRELWEYRELLYFLAWRDISVRYKQTVLGAAWAIIQPFFTMVVFSVFFGRLAKLSSKGIPYPIFAYCALLPWHYFAEAMSRSSDSLVVDSNLIRIENLSKQYRIGARQNRHDTLRDQVANVFLSPVHRLSSIGRDLAALWLGVAVWPKWCEDERRTTNDEPPSSVVHRPSSDSHERGLDLWKKRE